nr:MAG TPA: hypothetical protein [Caudoviricetes sp.]
MFDALGLLWVLGYLGSLGMIVQHYPRLLCTTLTLFNKGASILCL